MKSWTDMKKFIAVFSDECGFCGGKKVECTYKGQGKFWVRCLDAFDHYVRCNDQDGFMLFPYTIQKYIVSWEELPVEIAKFDPDKIPFVNRQVKNRITFVEEMSEELRIRFHIPITFEEIQEFSFLFQIGRASQIWRCLE